MHGIPPLSNDSHHLVELCANVQRNFDRIAAFAETHDISLSAALFFVLIGSQNIRSLDGAHMMFEPVTPAQIAKVAKMTPKTVSRWCTLLAERKLLRRHKGAYAIEQMSDWYLLAGCLQGNNGAPLPGLATAGLAPLPDDTGPNRFADRA